VFTLNVDEFGLDLNPDENRKFMFDVCKYKKTNHIETNSSIEKGRGKRKKLVGEVRKRKGEESGRGKWERKVGEESGRGK
jgi:hypothetical protein